MVDSAAVSNAQALPRRRVLFTIFLTVLLDLIGFGMILPILPFYGQRFGATAGQVGLLFASYSLAQLLFAPPLGRLSDRIGRRPVLVTSIAGSVLAYLLFAFAPSFWVLVLARALSGVAASNYSIAQAYLADISTPENRSKAMGMIGAAFGLGFICGPILGGLLGAVNLHLPFYVAAGLSLANFTYGYFFVPESLPHAQRGKFRLTRVNPLAGLVKLAGRKDIRGLLVTFALVTSAQMMLQSTWVLYTHFRFNWSPAENGIALFCVGLAAAVVQAGLLGVFMKRFGEVRLSLLGITSGCITYMLYGLATQGWMMYVFILCNLLAFAAGPALQGIISKATPASEQGELMGSLQSISSAAIVVMPLVGTAILGAVSHLPPSDWRIGSSFFVCAIMQGIAIVVARRYFRSHT